MKRVYKVLKLYYLRAVEDCHSRFLQVVKNKVVVKRMSTEKLKKQSTLQREIAEPGEGRRQKRAEEEREEVARGRCQRWTLVSGQRSPSARDYA